MAPMRRCVECGKESDDEGDFCVGCSEDGRDLCLDCVKKHAAESPVEGNPGVCRVCGVPWLSGHHARKT